MIQVCNDGCLRLFVCTKVLETTLCAFSRCWHENPGERKGVKDKIKW